VIIIYLIKHRVYSEIVRNVKEGKLKEPFSVNDFRSSCKGFAEGTYKAFLYKHRKYNLNGNTELFIKVGKAKFKLLRPIRYNMA